MTGEKASTERREEMFTPPSADLIYNQPMAKTRRKASEITDPLGNIFRRARHALVPPLTQQDVADRLGVRQSTVSGWESGGARPDLPTLNELATLLDLDFTNLAAVAAANPTT